MKKEIFVIKASGEKELFSDYKLRHSLEKTKAPSDVIGKIIDQIRKETKDDAKTSVIYHRAFSLLHEQDRVTAGRYALKRAVMSLGPSGHPFEKLVGELFKTKGFAVKVGETVSGACVSHEIDVIAEKDGRCLMIECKFHNQPGTKSDVKTALYVQARFEDIQKQWRKKPNHSREFHEAWLVTNTKLTSDAIQYASCAGLKAIGWDYPPENGLQNLIENAGLHPLTCLTTLSDHHKQLLLNKGLVLCKDIIKNRNLLREIGLNESKIKPVEQEINNLHRPV